MPLKRIYCRNEGKRLHQRAGSGLFSCAGGLSGRKPKGSPEQLPRATEERSPICPPFAPCFQMFLYFCPLWVSENPEETPMPLKKCFTFAPFQPILCRFAPVVGGPDAPEGIQDRKPDRGTEALHHPTKRGTQQDQLPRWCRSAPDAASQ